jgi:hypothetical protein
VKLKHKYRIGTRVFKVKVMRDGWREDANARGQIEYNKRTIKFAADEVEGMKVLLHEVIHALDAEHFPGEPIDESRVWVLGDHIVQFCRDNQVDLREELEL